VAVPLIAGGCGGSAGGDPGGHRLAALAGDPVFASVPPGATAVDRTRTPAQKRPGGFTGGGWAGPSYVVSFTSAASPREVYGFYGNAAQNAGWTPTGTGAVGLTDRWKKTFPDGAPATLLLSRLSNTSYRLSGGIAPASG
jgi:hypothetical protein